MDKLIQQLKEIGEKLRTQDNRMTASPMFCVQIKVRDVGYDPAYSDRKCWHDSANEETIFDDDPDFKEPHGDEWDEFGYRDRWETVMVAFTEAGCEQYLKSNGHNDRARAHKGEVRIYVESFHRCAEMMLIREALKDGVIIEVIEKLQADLASMTEMRDRAITQSEVIENDLKRRNLDLSAAVSWLRSVLEMDSSSEGYIPAKRKALSSTPAPVPSLIPIVCQLGKDILLNPAGVKEAHRSLTYTHIHMLDGKIYQVSDDDQKVWNQLRKPNLTDQASKVLAEIDEQLAVLANRKPDEIDRALTIQIIERRKRRISSGLGVAVSEQEISAESPILGACAVCPKSLRCLKTAMNVFLSDKQWNEQTTSYELRHDSLVALTAIITQWNENERQ